MDPTQPLDHAGTQYYFDSDIATKEVNYPNHRCRIAIEEVSYPIDRSRVATREVNDPKSRCADPNQNWRQDRGLYVVLLLTVPYVLGLLT